jgi:hypothetical protein
MCLIKLVESAAIEREGREQILDRAGVDESAEVGERKPKSLTVPSPY